MLYDQGYGPGRSQGQRSEINYSQGYWSVDGQDEGYQPGMNQLGGEMGRRQWSEVRQVRKQSSDTGHSGEEENQDQVIEQGHERSYENKAYWPEGQTDPVEDD